MGSRIQRQRRPQTQFAAGDGATPKQEALPAPGRLGRCFPPRSCRKGVLQNGRGTMLCGVEVRGQDEGGCLLSQPKVFQRM